MPDQINEYWDVIKRVVMISGPPAYRVDENTAVNILQAALNDQMQVFLVLEKGVKRIAVVLTALQYDHVLEKYNLLLYSIYSFVGSLPKEAYDYGFKFFKTFAKMKGCSSITLYTISEEITE